MGGEDFILSQRSGVEEELFKGQVRSAGAHTCLAWARATLLQPVWYGAASV